MHSKNQIASGDLSDKELSDAQELLAFAEDSLKNLEEKVGYQADFNKALDETLRRQKNITKATGLSGKLVKGLGGLAEKIGFGDIGEELESVNKKMEEQAIILTDNGRNAATMADQFKILGTGLSGLGSIIMEQLSDPLVIIGLIVKAVKELFSIFQHVLQVTKDVGQAFGVAGANAKTLKAEIHAAGDASGDIFYFTEELLDAQKQLNEEAGLNLKFNKENAMAFQDLTLYAGYSADQIRSLAKLSYEAGVPLMEMEQSVVGTLNAANESSDTFLTQRQIFDQLRGASGSVRFNIKGGAEGLVRAAHVAARLGTSMNEIAAAAESHLDFESSIAKEIEAEMFLQKDLNLDKLRMAAITGDTELAAREQERLIRENMGQLEGNVPAQKAFAATLGISSEELATQIQRQKELKNLSGEQLKDKIAEGEQLAEDGKKAVEFERTFLNASKQIKAALEPLANELGPLIISMVKQITPIITQTIKFFNTGVGKTLLALGAGFMAIKAASGLVSGIMSIFSGVQKVFVMNPGFGGGGAGGGGYMGGGAGSGKGGPKFDKKSGRFRDPKTGRFTKAPSGGRSGGGGRRRMRGRGLGGLAVGLGSMLGMNYLLGQDEDHESGRSMTTAMGMTGMDLGLLAAESGADALVGGGTKSAAKGAAKGGGGFFSNMFGGIKGWFSKNIKGIFPKILGSIKKPLKGILTKIPFVGGILELLFTGMDVNEIAQATDMSPEEMYSQIGASVISGGLGLTMGSLAATAVSSLQAVGIPGWLLAGAAYMGGDYLGRMLGNAISDYVGGPVLGKGIFDLFYGDKGSEPVELANGGMVSTATNAIVGEAGPEAVIPLNEFYAKFDELIDAVKQGGDVYLDGNKVGYSLALQSSQNGLIFIIKPNKTLNYGKFIKRQI